MKTSQSIHLFSSVTLLSATVLLNGCATTDNSFNDRRQQRRGGRALSQAISVKYRRMTAAPLRLAEARGQRRMELQGAAPRQVLDRRWV